MSEDTRPTFSERLQELKHMSTFEKGSEGIIEFCSWVGKNFGVGTGMIYSWYRESTVRDREPADFIQDDMAETIVICLKRDKLLKEEYYEC